MPSKSYSRCQYVSPDGTECELWIPVSEKDEDLRWLCPSHRDIARLSPEDQRKAEEARARQSEDKHKVIDSQNAERVLCYQCFKDIKSPKPEEEERLSTHIAELEKVYEDLKLKIGTARAVRREIEESFSQEERERRRKIKVKSTKVEPDEKTKKVSVKKDPLEHLIQLYMSTGQSREEATKNAKSMLGN